MTDAEILQQYQMIRVVFEDSKTTIMSIYRYMANEGVGIDETIYDFSDNPPGANAGPDQNVSKGAVVTLDGSRTSYPLTGIKGYEWTQVSGTPVALSSRTIVKPTFTVPAGAATGSSFVFQLKMYNNSSGSSTDTTTINVRSSSSFKTISAQEANRLIDSRNDVVVVDVSDVDDYCSSEGHIPCSENYPWDSGALQLRYTKLSKSALIIVTSANGAQSELAAGFLASKGFGSVYDMGDMSDWAWRTASCEETCNNPPIADAGRDFSVDEGIRIVLDGSDSSDPDGDSLSYKWVQKSGVATVALSDKTSPRPSFDVPDIGPDGGTLTFRLTVTDSNGSFTSDEVTVRISWVPDPGYNKISSQEAKDMIDSRDDLIVIDVREASEYCGTLGHIPCSLNYAWDTGVLQAKYTELPLEADILIACNSGNRSAYAAEFLLSKGFTNIYDMGGINVWQEETATCEQPCDRPAVVDSQKDFTIEGFVTRFYQLCLSRNPEKEGLNGWMAALENGQVTGADLAEGFIFSEEFKNRGTTDEAFLSILYRALLNREPDSEGVDGWLSELNAGASRADIVDAFVSSEEFSNLAAVYGITPYPLDPVVAFASHFYKAGLNRNPDPTGLDSWVDALKNGWASGADIAVNFVLSPEFMNRGLTDEDFLTVLYQTLLNREPDSTGLSRWLDALKLGMSRSDVLEGFAASEEFANRCRTFGVSAVNSPNYI